MSEITNEEEHPRVSELLNEKTPIQARHILPGQGQAFEVKTGQFLQIQTLQGKQVADFVAFSLGDTDEYLSTSATRATNGNIIPRLGTTLYSNRRQPMFEIVEDSVGRHDMLYACCDPVRYELLGAPGHASCRQALTESLSSYGIGYDRIPSPINWFMNVSIQQRGELEIREPLAEQGDHVVLRALKDVVAAISACPQDLGPTNGFNPTDLSVRVYRDAPLPLSPTMADGTGGTEQPAVVMPESAEEPDSSAPAGEATGDIDKMARRAARRAERRAAASAESTLGADAGATAPVPADEPTVLASASVGAPGRSSRPGRLQDTAEASVLRVETGDSEGSA